MAAPSPSQSVVKLTTAERASDLKTLLDQGWSIVDGRDAIKKTFKFNDFNQVSRQSQAQTPVRMR